MTSPMKKRIYTMRRGERLATGFIYLGAVLPIWGLLLAWTLRESWRQRSRVVVVHATQAIWAQTALLVAFIVYAITGVALNITSQLGDRLGGMPRILDVVRNVNDGVIVTLAGFYVAVCLVAAWFSLDGKNVRLPIIGPRVWAQEFDEDESE